MSLAADTTIAPPDDGAAAQSGRWPAPITPRRAVETNTADDPRVVQLRGGVIATRRARGVAGAQAPDPQPVETRPPRHRVLFTRRPEHNGQLWALTGRVAYVNRPTSTPQGRQEPISLASGRLTDRRGAPEQWALRRLAADRADQPERHA